MIAMFKFRSIPVVLNKAESTSDSITHEEMLAALPKEITVWSMGISMLADGGADVVDERSIELMSQSWKDRGHDKIGFDCNHAAFFGMTPEQAGNHALGDVIFDKDRGVVVENIEYTSKEIVEALYNKRLRFWSPSFTPELADDGQILTVNVEINGKTVQALRPASLKNVAFTDVPMTNSQPPLMQSLRDEMLKELRNDIVSNMADNNETIVTGTSDDAIKRQDEMPSDSEMAGEDEMSDMDELKEQVADLESKLAEKDALVQELEAKLAEYEAKEMDSEMESIFESIGASEKQRTYWRSQGIDALRGYAETVDPIVESSSTEAETVSEDKIEKIVTKRSLNRSATIDNKTPTQAAALRTIEAHRQRNNDLRARLAGGNK